MNNGPKTLIILRANICVPEISFNVGNLEFGEVFVGQGKSKVFQIHNASPVTAEWEIMKGKNEVSAARTFQSTLAT